MEHIFPIKDVKSHYEEMNENFCPNSVMIIGPSNSCKTSLLMQAAISKADAGNPVLFVSPQRLSKLPVMIHGMPQPSSNAMKNIHFLYAKEKSEVQGYLASLHLRPIVDIPSVIIVDDLNYYCALEEEDPLGQLVCLAKLCSLIQEAASFKNQLVMEPLTNDKNEAAPNPQSTPSLVLMAWTTYQGSKDSTASVSGLQEIGRKICSQIWSIENKKGSKEGACSFQLEKPSKEGKFIIEYSLKRVNPNLQLIYAGDIFLEVND